MSYLSQIDVKKLLDVIAGLQEPVTTEGFGAQLTRLIGDFIPGVICAFDEIDLTSGAYRISHNCPLSEADNQRMFGRLTEVYQQNPIYDYVQQGGTEQIVLISDLMPRSKIQCTDLYNDVFKPVGIEHQINVLVPTEGCLSTLTLNRDRDFPTQTMELCRMLIRHIQLAHQSARVFSELESMKHGVEDGGNKLGLTAREVELLHWIQEGKRNNEIGLILAVSPRTVEKHVENILRKLGVETRTAAAKAALRISSVKPRIRHGVVGINIT